MFPRCGDNFNLRQNLFTSYFPFLFGNKITQYVNHLSFSLNCVFIFFTLKFFIFIIWSYMSFGLPGIFKVQINNFFFGLSQAELLTQSKMSQKFEKWLKTQLKELRIRPLKPKEWSLAWHWVNLLLVLSSDQRSGWWCPRINKDRWSTDDLTEEVRKTEVPVWPSRNGAKDTLRLHTYNSASLSAISL